MIHKLGVSVSVYNYVVIEEYEKIYEEQEALSKAEAEPSEVESDESSACQCKRSTEVLPAR